jgi:hypothetical protein
MKMLATAFCVLGGGILFSSGAPGTSTTPERPKFKIEIRATGEKRPGYAVTNLTAKTVTACVFELSYSSQGTRRSKIVWDALVQGDPPSEPGRTTLRPLFPIVESSVPNKVEVIAGVWAGLTANLLANLNGQTISSKTVLCAAPSAKTQLQYYSGDWTRIEPPTSISRLSATSQTRALSILSAPRWQ